MALMTDRACAFKGSPASALADLTFDPDQREKLMAALPADLKFQLRAQDIVVRCSNVLAKNGLQIMSKDQVMGMDMTIDAFLSQLREIQGMSFHRFLLLANIFLADSTLLSTTSALTNAITRLSICTFSFYQSPTQYTRKADLVSQLITDATEVISTLSTPSPSTSSTLRISIARPSFLLYALLLATSVLLRLSKLSSSTTSSQLDTAAAAITNTIHKAIHIAQEMSITQNDIPSRAATLFMQLLESKKAFIRPNSPSDQLQVAPLRVRSRLVMSIVIDAWGWWREEFGSNPPPLPEIRAQTNPVNQEDGSTAQTAPMQGEGEGYTLNNQPISAAAGTLNIDAAGNWAAAQYPSISNPGIDMAPFSGPVNFPFPQDDLFDDIWHCWPDEVWGGIPGFS
jgi:hypothetical protein